MPELAHRAVGSGLVGELRTSSRSGLGTKTTVPDRLHDGQQKRVRLNYFTADTPRLDIRYADGSTVGFVDLTKEFKYLGSIIDSSLTSNADVDMRLYADNSSHISIR